jgi:hypothetical protein
MPPREIVRPNLLKERYFRSGNNSPNESEDEEDFDIEDVLNGRHRKKKKIAQAKVTKEYNPFEQGKSKGAKKKTKEGLDMKLDTSELKQKIEKEKKKQEKYEEEEKYQQYQENIKRNNYTTPKYDLTNGNKNDEEEYLMKKQFYEKMLNEENDDNDSVEEQKNYKKNSNKLSCKNKQNTNGKFTDRVDNEENYEEQACVSCQSNKYNDSKPRLRKKENPALMEPQVIR